MFIGAKQVNINQLVKEKQMIEHDSEVLRAVVVPPRKKNAIRITLVLALTVFSISCNTAHSKMCKTMTADGKPVFMWAKDKNGRDMITKNVSGRIATMQLCPEEAPVIVRKEIVEEYKIPNPQTQCEKAAVLSCDPSWGGLPVCTTGNLANFCGFCFVSTTDVNGHNVVTRYLNGAPYDGSKMVEGVQRCPVPVNLSK